MNKLNRKKEIDLPKEESSCHECNGVFVIERWA